MLTDRDEQRHVEVVVCNTQATADLACTTLAVHGIRASSARAGIVPALDWVEGFRVVVDRDDVDRARRILTAMRERDDVADPPAG